MSKLARVALTALLAIAASLPALSRADALAGSLVLVAKPQMKHPLYARTVLVVKSFGAGQHLGFIVNRPSRYRLGAMFPGHAPSQKVTDPVFVGGPVDRTVLFALVAAEESPGKGSIRMMPGLYAAFDGATVDRIIETEADDARFVAGLVVWRPGELAAEMAQGAWYALDADPALALRDPEGLWEELAMRGARRRA